MIQRITLSLFALGVGFLLSACGGEDLNGFVETRDLRLSELELVSGGRLFANGAEVEEFDNEFLGLYDVELDNNDVDTLEFRAVADPASGEVDLFLVRLTLDDDNRLEEEAIQSGTPFSVPVSDGNNRFRIEVRSREIDTEVAYQLRVRKTSSNTRLSDIRIDGFTSEQLENRDDIDIDLDPSFDPAVRSYRVDVEGNFCAVFIAAITEDAFASLEIDGDFFANNSARLIPLTEGVGRQVDIAVLPSDGSESESYQVEIVRGTATDEQVQADATLASVEFSEGRSIAPFNCRASATLIAAQQRLSLSQSSFGLTVSPTRTAATMVLGSADSSGTVAEEGRVTLTAGETYTGDLVSDLEVGVTRLGLIVTAPDGETTRTYILEIERLGAEEVFVQTTEELHAALRSAQPNDFIAVAPGEYVGMPSAADSETGSGHPEAYFYSNASGLAATDTEDAQPITLFAQVPLSVRLVGDDRTQHAAFRLDGSYWEVVGFQFAEAQTGIRVGGSYNLLSTSTVSEVGGRGLVFADGASENIWRSGAINQTGLEQLIDDASMEALAEAIVVGEGEGTAMNNVVTFSTFGRDVLGESVDIKANAGGTVLTHNLFDLDNTLVTDPETRSVVLVGADAEVDFNAFFFNFIEGGEDDLNEFVRVDAANEASVSVSQNQADLDARDLVFINGAGGAPVSAIANERIDGNDAALRNTGSVDTSGAIASFQIQSTRDASLCLTERTISITATGTSTELGDFQGAVMTPCADDPAQRWQWVHSELGRVFIARADNPAKKLQRRLLTSLVGGNATTELLVVREDVAEGEPGSNNNAGFSLQWLPLRGEAGRFEFVARSTLVSLSTILEIPDFEVNGLAFSELPMVVGIDDDESSSQFLRVLP